MRTNTVFHTIAKLPERDSSPQTLWLFLYGCTFEINMQLDTFGSYITCLFVVFCILCCHQGSASTIEVSSSCNSSLQFYDISALQCMECPVNQERTTKNNDCECSEGYLKIYDSELITYNCSDYCTQNNQVPPSVLW